MPKYRFKTRAEAEAAYQEADGKRMRAEWFATAILQGRTVDVGEAMDGDKPIRVGYFVTQHSGFVYAVADDPRCIHTIRGVWNEGDMGLLINGQSWRGCEDYRDLLITAQKRAAAALSEVWAWEAVR